MDDIGDLEQRLAVALDQIAIGVDTLITARSKREEPAQPLAPDLTAPSSAPSASPPGIIDLENDPFFQRDPEPEITVPDISLEEEIDRLKAALESESAVNAQLEARVAAQKQRADEAVDKAEAEIARAREDVIQRDAEIEALTQQSHVFQERIDTLAAQAQEAERVRAQCAELMAERDGLVALREDEKAALDHVLRRLKPVLEENEDA